MSQFDHRPSDDRAKRMRGLLTGARDKASDDQLVMSIYQDFKWRMSVLPEQTYQAIEALIDQKIVECQAKLKTTSIREAVVQKFEQMRNRVSEFMTSEEPNDENHQQSGDSPPL